MYQRWVLDVVSCGASTDYLTDAGVSALGAGCGLTQSIYISGCNKVTDAGMSVLGAGCGLLQYINLRDVEIAIR